MKTMHPLTAALFALATLPAQAQAQHAGHDQHTPMTQQTDADTHADHASHASKETSPLSDFIPTPTPEDMAPAFPDMHGMDMSDHMIEDPWITHAIVEQLERDLGDDPVTGWSVQAWTGKTHNRLWLESEGAREAHGSHGNISAYWGHATGPWWDRMIGWRRDFDGGVQRDWVGIGVHGHAPYKFDVEATAFVGTSGRAMLEGKASYDVLLTNRLILQPEVGLAIHAKDDVRMGVGKGVSELHGGLRLRYEFSHEFAPYIGWRYARSFGNTADMRAAHDESATEHEWVAGIRFWF